MVYHLDDQYTTIILVTTSTFLALCIFYLIYHFLIRKISTDSRQRSSRVRYVIFTLYSVSYSFSSPLLFRFTQPASLSPDIPPPIDFGSIGIDDCYDIHQMNLEIDDYGVGSGHV